jgi:hypothetical protein
MSKQRRSSECKLRHLNAKIEDVAAKSSICSFECHQIGTSSGTAIAMRSGEHFEYKVQLSDELHLKPTWVTLISALLMIKEHAIEHRVKCIALSMSFVESAGFQWKDVKKILDEVFVGSPITIDVCTP